MSQIIVDDVSKRFRLYTGRANSLKERVTARRLERPFSGGGERLADCGTRRRVRALPSVPALVDGETAPIDAIGMRSSRSGT